MAKSGLLHELEPIRLPALGSLIRLAWRRCRELGVAQLGSVFGVLLVLCGALWALGEYTSYKAQLRAAGNRPLHQRVRGGAGGGCLASPEPGLADRAGAARHLVGAARPVANG